MEFIFFSVVMFLICVCVARGMVLVEKKYLNEGGMLK
jgi:hypothetical protein